jgi:hypothetical protein
MGYLVCSFSWIQAAVSLFFLTFLPLGSCGSFTIIKVYIFFYFYLMITLTHGFQDRVDLEVRQDFPHRKPRVFISEK